MLSIQQLANNFQVKKHSTITFSGAIFGLSIAYFIVTGDAAETATSLDALQVILSFAIGILSAYGVYYTAGELDKLFPWHKHEGNRLLVGIIVHFIVLLSASSIGFYIANLFLPDIFDFEEIREQYLRKLLIVILILTLFIEIVYFALYSYYSYTTFQIETVRQERKQIELQLKALKSQLSPHFLFNSLNTISSLVFKDKNKAEGFIRKLAEMYQYTLHSYQTKLTTLEQELEFVNSYQYLLQTRFGSRFQYTVDVREELLSTKIPPLTLQMLIENAVKHNVLSEGEPLKVEVTSNEKYIVVKNNVTRRPQKVSSFQIGLKNINARYLILHKEGILVSNGADFEVKIPLIK